MSQKPWTLTGAPIKYAASGAQRPAVGNDPVLSGPRTFGPQQAAPGTSVGVQGRDDSIQPSSSGPPSDVVGITYSLHHMTSRLYVRSLGHSSCEFSCKGIMIVTTTPFVFRVGMLSWCFGGASMAVKGLREV